MDSNLQKQVNTQAETVRLSVAMIVRDAEAALAETIDSLKSWPIGAVDEVVIVDTGSSDQTLKLAKTVTDQVHQVTWENDFSKARNATLKFVSGNWVLWLDAGETMQAEDITNLRRYLETKADPLTAYALLVRIPPVNGEICGEQVAKIRLIPNLDSIQFTGRLEETVEPSLRENEIKLEGLPWTIDRSQRYHDPEVKQKRAQRNLKIADLEISQQGNLSSVMFSVCRRSPFNFRGI